MVWTTRTHDQKIPTTADHCLFIAPMVWTTRTHDQKIPTTADHCLFIAPMVWTTLTHDQKIPQPQIIAYLLHQWYGPQHMTRRSPQPQIIAYLLHQWYGPHEHMTRRSHNRRSLPIYCTNGMDHTNT